MVVAGGFVSLFVMRRWVLGSFATLGAIGLVGALVYSSWPETSYRFWEYTCERPVEVTTAQPAFDPNGAALEAVPKETETFETSVSNCEYYNSRGYVSGDWQSGVRTDVRFDWDQFWLYTLTGWAVGNGAIAALFVVTSWIPRSVREGVVRGLRRRDR